MCRSRRELSNEYLLAKFGLDKAKNQPASRERALSSLPDRCSASCAASSRAALQVSASTNKMGAGLTCSPGESPADSAGQGCTADHDCSDPVGAFFPPSFFFLWNSGKDIPKRTQVGKKWGTKCQELKSLAESVAKIWQISAEMLVC